MGSAENGDFVFSVIKSHSTMAGMTQNKRLKYFPGHNSENDVLEILLVSTSQQYLEELQKNLYITRQVQSDKRTFRLKVHTCKQIKDVLSLTSNDFTVDFIVFILDINNVNTIFEVQTNMNSLDSTFGREKLCLVNPNPGFGNSAVTPFDVWDFAQQCQINLINGKISDQEKLTNLSKRILNLAEACCGVVNGLPLIGYI